MYDYPQSPNIHASGSSLDATGGDRPPAAHPSHEQDADSVKHNPLDPTERPEVGRTISVEIAGVAIAVVGLVVLTADPQHVWSSLEMGMSGQIAARAVTGGGAIFFALRLRTLALARHVHTTLRTRKGTSTIGTLLAEEEIKELSDPKWEFGEYASFPFPDYLSWVRQATHLRIVGTYLFLLTVPEYQAPFIRALLTAINQGATVDIALLCPESKAAERRARELKVPLDQFRTAIEDNLWIIYTQVWLKLDDEARKRFTVKLYPDTPPPQGPQYVCDDIALLSSLPLGYPSQESAHLSYPANHPHVKPLDDFFVQMWGRGLPFLDHMTTRVQIKATGGQKIPGVKFVDETSVRYLAVNGRDLRDELASTARITVKHCTEPTRTYLPTLIQSAGNGPLITSLDTLLRKKYSAPTGEYFFFRLDPETP